jgi:hypothetical protein
MLARLKAFFQRKPDNTLVRLEEKLYMGFTTGYKAVRIIINRHLELTYGAIIKLRIPADGTIRYSDNDGKDANYLVDGTKYCTNQCVVESVVFYGTGVKQFVKNFVLRQNLRLIGNMCTKKEFVYPLGEWITDEEAFEPGAFGCQKGIHFYTNEVDAIKFMLSGLMYYDTNFLLKSDPVYPDDMGLSAEEGKMIEPYRSSSSMLRNI